MISGEYNCDYIYQEGMKKKMLSMKDEAVVASMVRTGMSLDTLKRSFPQFDAADVEKVYMEEKRMTSDELAEEIKISCNCS